MVDEKAWLISLAWYEEEEERKDEGPEDKRKEIRKRFNSCAAEAEEIRGWFLYVDSWSKIEFTWIYCI